MSSLAPVPSPLQSTESISSSTFRTSSGPNTTLLICVTIGTLVLSAVIMAGIAALLWRKSSNQGQPRRASEQPKQQEDNSVTACRKPVVIINPSEDSISYGRKESSYFPSFFRLGRRSIAPEKEEQLPAAAEGGYYIKGAPGFFECDLEMGYGEDVSKAGSKTTTDSSMHSPVCNAELSFCNILPRLNIPPPSPRAGQDTAT